MPAADSRPSLKTSFRAERTFEPFHTGGKTALSGDGLWLVSTLNEQAVLTNLTTGERIGLLEGDTSAVTTLSITPSPSKPADGGFVVTCARSLALQIYSLPSLELVKMIPRAHTAPIIVCASDPTGTLFATGSSDGMVKVWDYARGHCTHVLKGHGGVVSALHFDIDSSSQSGRARLISGADDCRIRVWDLKTRECVHVLEGHVSVVRGLVTTSDGRFLVSGGRDKVVNLWDLERGALKRTTPVFETVETVGLVYLNLEEGKGKGKARAEKCPVFYTAGDRGAIRLWDLSSGNQIEGSVSESTGKIHEILDVMHCQQDETLTTVTVDQNFVTYALPSLRVERQLSGFNDEVIDLCYLSTSEDEPDSHLAVATNSDLVRVYDLSKFSTTFLEGHQDVVLCLARSQSGDTLLTGSKDRTTRIWKYTDEAWRCVACATGHIESVGAVTASRRTNSFFISASQDRTAKVWDLASLENLDADAQSEPVNVRALTTVKIHDKDINSLDIAPNDKLLVSGSQDRTAKLFAIDYKAASKSTPSSASLKHLGTFKGHKRGVWSVKFSRNDQAVATASGDRTIRLWSLADFSCIKVFEGHSNSVLRVDFLTAGMQLASCASDGLVKVWNVKDEECIQTLDNHEDKVWALAIPHDETHIVSAGADSVITLWKDVTEAEQLERFEQEEERVTKEQDFVNYVSLKQYSQAILLALSMDQPKRLLNLLTSVRLGASDTQSSYTGSASVDAVIRSLSPAHLKQLLIYVRDWNTIARSADVAQGVLLAILKSFTAEQILEAFETPSEDAKDSRTDGKRRKKEVKASDVLGALIPYTERHYARADRLVRESYIVEHTLGMMDSFGDDDDGMELDAQAPISA